MDGRGTAAIDVENETARGNGGRGGKDDTMNDSTVNST